jgi:sulfatase modifying factor 1
VSRAASKGAPLPGPTRALIGRADLLWIAASRGEGELAQAASRLGFVSPSSAKPSVKEPGAQDEEARRDEEGAARGKGTTQGTRKAEAAAAAPLLSVPFFRAESASLHETPTRARVEARGPEITRDHPALRPASLFATPRPEPLAPWSALWPALHHRLPSFLPGREPDVAAYVRAYCRGDELRRIPRRPRRAWAMRVSLWIDRSRRLVPFWSDQDQVAAALRGACGRSGLALRVLGPVEQDTLIEDDGSFLPGFSPDPEVAVLVLGDLGAYGDARERAAWLRTAEALQAQGVRLSALVPCSPGRIDRALDPALARAWGAIPWERGRRAIEPDRAADPALDPAREAKPKTPALAPVERLLRLLSPASLVQPGLMRALRKLLPEADCSTEADLWKHPKVRAADASGLVLEAQAARSLREAFARREDRALHEEALAQLRRWHARLPRSLWLGELVTWIGLGLEAPPKEVADAEDFVRGLEASALAGARGRERDAELGAALRGFERKLLPALPASAFEAIPALVPVLAAAMAGVERPHVPEGMSPSELFATLGPPEEKPIDWLLLQRVSALVFARAGGRKDTPVLESPMAILPARGRVWVRRGEEKEWEPVALEEGVALELHAGERVVLHSDVAEVVIGSGPREPWASAMGRDRFGLWADAEIRGVKQRFRWIPPGSFGMGSPEGEAGRLEREGPRQRVTWTEGRWMADTPVTQALWVAVMGKNPSRFKSPERPVENVSWEDCKAFLEKLGGIAPLLGARLPSEAEWEYACRAGTETATWLGDLEIRGERDAPLLDSIAWYGGNSGKDYDLDEGHDSSGWDQKQYDHKKAGTRKVKGKDANPWGLYDMLGNVWEWCEDHTDWPMKGHGKEVVVNPVPSTTGSGRVIRGGSWRGVARYVRAAFRDAHPAGRRNFGLGFRLARGLAPSQGAEPQNTQGWAGTRSGPATRDAGRGLGRGTERDAPSPTNPTSPTNKPRKG